MGVDGFKDFWPISLISSTYKILDKVLVGRIQKKLTCIISMAQGSFVYGSLILNGVLANEHIHSRNR